MCKNVYTQIQDCTLIKGKRLKTFNYKWGTRNTIQPLQRQICIHWHETMSKVQCQKKGKQNNSIPIAASKNHLYEQRREYESFYHTGDNLGRQEHCPFSFVHIRIMWVFLNMYCHNIFNLKDILNKIYNVLLPIVRAIFFW